ncbi:hypothetical protein L2E82_38432 [Cichorium intybus]|uniref:Uncharacterized protein n=1 Tax=Cichorium intybus TaxID=13427 RepID=A0ACB9AFT7_CICIN|nr:hypothetical protein L2E82_38432 [Cichorium intybus]
MKVRKGLISGRSVELSESPLSSLIPHALNCTTKTLILAVFRFIMAPCLSFWLDDLVMWGFKGFRTCNADLQRWVMPERYTFGKRPPIPLWKKNIKIIVGEPIKFDIAKLKQTALSTSRNLRFTENRGWPPFGAPDEVSQRCLYINISERIQNALQRLRVLGR